jgi:PPK2 family polyphosphate:nucleotide phosphotransferase
LTVVLKNWHSYLVNPGGRVRLAHISAHSTEFCDDKKAGRRQLKQYRKQIDELLNALAAEGKRSLLVILQGVDASGKDGAVRKVFTGVNPQHCRVVSFKEPDREEEAHDYLWRIHRAMPARGELAIFNRSQYEDVLVPQARGELSTRDAHARMRQIADLERTWAENGTVIRKLFLHISRTEQTRRFKARLENPAKHWKVQESDFKDRKLWPKFQRVYEEILARTSAPHAPWYIVPADHKWYRDLEVGGVVLSALRSMRPRVPVPTLDRRTFKL